MCGGRPRSVLSSPSSLSLSTVIADWNIVVVSSSGADDDKSSMSAYIKGNLCGGRTVVCFVRVVSFGFGR